MLSDLQIANLPTPLALAARRALSMINMGHADTFLAVSYLSEAFTRVVAIALFAGVQERVPDHAYRIAHGLVRADGLGAWETAIRDLSSSSLSGYLAPEFRDLIVWLTKRRTRADDEWARACIENAVEVATELGFPSELGGKPTAIRDLFGLLVRIRNKTKGHGAVGPDFFAKCNTAYARAVVPLLENCPLCQWDWIQATILGGSLRYRLLRGLTPQAYSPEVGSNYPISSEGVYFLASTKVRTYSCGDLILTNFEGSDFWLPNGGYSSGGAEFLSFSTGHSKRINMGKYVREPLPLPASETEGASNLDVQSNVFGNLPQILPGYVERPDLQRQLIARLKDMNHTVITLHGRGGVGKTSLALFAAHNLSDEATPHFADIVWFSARDIDLGTRGPRPVRQAVSDLDTVARFYGRLFGKEETVETFAEILRTPPTQNLGKGTLFIFDNFETVKDTKALHTFLDENAHIPNKILITSREREFKADYPIEVAGMEREEAFELMSKVSRQFGVEGLITDRVKEQIYDTTDGHAYIIRVMIAEISKDRKFVQPRIFFGSRGDIVDSVFERSFNKINPGSRYLFLLVTNWNSYVSEMALRIVLFARDIDVDQSLEECVKFSLLQEIKSSSAQSFFVAPQLARTFGQKKLQGDPDRLVLQEDLQTLRKFGSLARSDLPSYDQDINLKAFFDRYTAELSGADPDNQEKAERADRTLEAVAEIWKPGWLELARFRRRRGKVQGEIMYAYRRAVEELPLDPTALRERAEYAQQIGDHDIAIASLIAAVDIDAGNLTFLDYVAGEVIRFLSGNPSIPATRRDIYTQSLRSQLQQHADRLDARGMSRLAWLYLLSEDRHSAFDYASKGVRLGDEGGHCMRIIKRLSEVGHRQP